MRVALLLAGMLSAGFQAAQDPVRAPNPPASDPAPVFRASTRLVQVSVVVHDHQGQPVRDLTKEDFALTERGKPQAISFFAMESADAPVTPPPALPPHIFSNALADHAGVPNGVTVILLDLLNTSLFDQQAARRSLIKFLEQIQPHDRIALFALGQRSLTLLHDYTTDASSLLARLEKMKGEIPGVLDNSTLDPDTQQELEDLNLGDLADANEKAADFFTTGRVVNTLATLEAIAQHLSSLPGRKNLIWLSGGFPLTIGMDEVPQIGSARDRRMFTQEMDAAVRALNNSGVAVYPVDARGLMPMPGFQASTRGSARGIPPPVKLGPMVPNLDSMLELADRTGGRAAFNTNDLTRAITRAMDDARVTYTIGYYSTDPAQDGRFREIKVRVNRPGVDVRYRKGYFAFKPADISDKTRGDQIRAAVWTPIESTAVGVSARVDMIDQPPNTVNLFVQIDPATIAFRKDGDRWKANVDIVYVQKDEHGLLKGDGDVDRLNMALDEATYTKLVKDGFIRQRRVPREPGATTLRIVVRDAGTGATGSLTVPFSEIDATPKAIGK